MTNRIIFAVTGATGQPYAIRGLELLADTETEVHLIVSNAATLNLQQETTTSTSELAELAEETHGYQNIGAKPASGSFETEGMIVVPCSMKTLSNIATGNAENLIARAADVTLKEQRPLVVMPREKPFNRIHLKNMLEVSDAGGTIFPPFPSFYQKPESVDEIVTRTMARGLTYLGVDMEFEEWSGMDVAE